MASYDRPGVPADHSESFIDLDDLDLAGIDVQGWDAPAGESWGTPSSLRCIEWSLRLCPSVQCGTAHIPCEY
jgi:hypothetical protein